MCDVMLRVPDARNRTGTLVDFLNLEKSGISLEEKQTWLPVWREMRPGSSNSFPLPEAGPVETFLCRGLKCSLSLEEHSPVTDHLGRTESSRLGAAGCSRRSQEPSASSCRSLGSPRQTSRCCL